MNKKHIYFSFLSKFGPDRLFYRAEYAILDPSVIRHFLRMGFFGMNRKDSSKRSRYLESFWDISPLIEQGFFDVPIAGLDRENMESLNSNMDHIGAELERAVLRMRNPERSLGDMSTPHQDGEEGGENMFMVWAKDHTGKVLAEISFFSVTKPFVQNLRAIIPDFKTFEIGRLSATEFSNATNFPVSIYDYLSSLGEVYYCCIERDDNGLVPDWVKEKYPIDVYDYVADEYLEPGILRQKKWPGNMKKSNRRRRRIWTGNQKARNGNLYPPYY